MFCLSKSKSKEKHDTKENSTFTKMINNFFDLKPSSPVQEAPKTRLLSPPPAQGSNNLKTLLQHKTQRIDFTSSSAKDKNTFPSERQSSPQGPQFQDGKNRTESQRNVIGVAERVHTQSSMKSEDVKIRPNSINSGSQSGNRSILKNDSMFSATSQNFAQKPKAEPTYQTTSSAVHQMFHQKSTPSLNIQLNNPSLGEELKILSNRNYNYISSPFNKKIQKSKSCYYTTTILQAIQQFNRNQSQLTNKQLESIKHIKQSFDAIKTQCFKNELNIVPQFAKKLDPKKKTIVLDLDETLIHSVLIRSPSQGFQTNIRPHLMEFLCELKKYFNLVLWTASEKSYSEQIIRRIDPQRCLFNLEVYREHCSLGPKNQLLKDIRIFGVQLSQIFIVDNSTSTFVCDLDNGIPIIPFYNDQQDEELRFLLDFIMSDILPASDVRQVIRKQFRFQEFKNFNAVEHAVSFLYDSGF